MAAETDEPVLVREDRGSVVVFRLNRPEASNALDGKLMVAITEAFAAAEGNDEVRCVVLTGTGDRAFCSGLDLRGLADVNAVAGGLPKIFGSDDAAEGAAAFVERREPRWAGR